MMGTTGSCKGIETIPLSDRPQSGRAAATLFEYLPENAADRRRGHVTVPQLGGMFRGDFNKIGAGGVRLPAAVLSTIVR
jgi:excinuclease ABC subunit B